MIRTFTGQNAYLLAVASRHLPEIMDQGGSWRPARYIAEARVALAHSPDSVRLVADPRVLLEGMTGQGIPSDQFAQALTAAQSNPSVSPTLLTLLQE